MGRLFGGAEAQVTAFGARLAPDASPIARHISSAGNIQGVGYGGKTVDHRVTADIAVRVYVRTKLSRAELSQQELLPPEVNGRVTDVVSVGDIVVHARCGAGCRSATATSPQGTLGCLVRVEGDEASYILSDNHVLANVNQATLGDPIFEPGPADGGVEPIAELSAFETIKVWGPANFIDAAVARVLNPDDVLLKIEVIGAVRNPRRTPPCTSRCASTGAPPVTLSAPWSTSAPTCGASPVPAAGLVRGPAGRAGHWRRVQPAGRLGRWWSTACPAPLWAWFAGGRGVTFANPIEPVLARFNAAIVGE